MKVLLLLSLIFVSGFSLKALDTAASVTTTEFACLKKNGYDLAVIRAYHSYGGIDTNAIQTLRNAKAEGLKSDVYMFPCSTKSAATQADELYNLLKTNNLPYSRVWIDIESNPKASCDWKALSSNTARCNFIAQLVSELQKHGIQVGIYASHYEWGYVFAGDYNACKNFTGLPIWYAHYDNNPSFTDFVSFGGWTKPAAKQYIGTTTVCGVGIDVNNFPNGEEMIDSNAQETIELDQN